MPLVAVSHVGDRGDSFGVDHVPSPAAHLQAAGAGEATGFRAATSNLPALGDEFRILHHAVAATGLKPVTAVTASQCPISVADSNLVEPRCKVTKTFGIAASLASSSMLLAQPQIYAASNQIEPRWQGGEDVCDRHLVGFQSRTAIERVIVVGVRA